jgi:esterase
MQVRLESNVHPSEGLSMKKYIENFNYQITGHEQGPKLVFLHGLMGSGANFRSIAKAFESEYHILTFDQRGHGRSFQPDSGYHPRDFASDLKKILDDLQWERIHLVGHSMGGRNAVEFAAHFAQRVISLVIVDIGPESSTGAIGRIQKLLDLVPTPFDSRTAARNFFELEYPQRISFNPQPEVVSRFFLSNIEEKPDGKYDWRFAKDAIFSAMREGRQEDRWDALGNLRMPVLVIRGETSKDLPRDVFDKMLSLLPNGRGVEVPGAGHWVHADQPEAFKTALKQFFDSVR